MMVQENEGCPASMTAGRCRARPSWLLLLYDSIEPSLGSKEFFLRKGIGWALREYAWTDPQEVRRYVGENAARLSGLSRREALKNIAQA